MAAGGRFAIAGRESAVQLRRAGDDGRRRRTEILVTRVPATVLVHRLLLLLGLLLGGSAGAAVNEETIFLFQNRKLTIAVPSDLGFSSSKNERGIISFRLGHPREKISLEVAFLPDPDGRFATARNRKEFMNDTFQDYLGDSVEKAMQFEELDPTVGSGTYCIFTDAKLVGQTKIPRGEYLHTTTGLKAWPGVVAVFTLFSNDTDSKEYREVMTMLRQSVIEVQPPRL